MKNYFLNYVFFLICWLLITNVSAQNKKDCGTNCFQTNILSIDSNDEGCTSYELEITYTGNCESALSHYSVEVPDCASIMSVSNSQNWKQELSMTDPTTGIAGFKIDDINEFGDNNSLTSFTVLFTLCTNENNCQTKLNCWAPVVAYKAGQCIFYDSLTVQCQSLEANLVKKDLSCFESADGEISIEIVDGVEPYEFEWSNGATSQQIIGLSSGNYSVTITDGIEQQLTLETTLVQPNEIMINGLVTDADCSGVNNGAIDIMVSGDYSPYSYSWSNGATSEDLNSISAGSYQVVVMDGTGCSNSMQFQVGNKSNITINGVVTNASCIAENGAINITIEGGAEPYTYQWSNGATNEDIIDLGQGGYSIIVTDANGCQSSQSYSVRAINTLSLFAQVTKTGCIENNSGAINLSIAGGTEPYAIQWSNGETTEDIDGLAAGDYSVVVTDAMGCEKSLKFIVSSDKISLFRTITNPSCHGESDGSVSVIPTSGVEPYSFLWSTGDTGTELTGLSSGIYSVTVTDATGCSSTYSVYIAEPTQITGSYSVSNNNCNAEGDFSIDLSVSGGTAPYTYDWSNGEATQDLDSLNSDVFTVVVTDANNCTWEQEILIEGSPIDITCSIESIDTSIICNTEGYVLISNTLNADQYFWSISSSNGSWNITSGQDSSEITYSSGNEGSSATITLIVQKDGCSQTCSIDLQGCTVDNGDNGDGDNDDDSGDVGDDSECGESFSSEISLVSVVSDCYIYEAIINYNGNHTHGLSHFTIDIPCGNVSQLSNDGNWKNVIGGTDPTTGLWGIKIDDIIGFGEGSDSDSFTVNFTVCNVDNDCQGILDNWNAVVAFKAGQCVDYDTIAVVDEFQESVITSNAYPNPFKDNLNIELEISENSFAILEILNYQGELVKEIFKGEVHQGDEYSFNIDTGSWPGGIYYSKLNLGGKVKIDRIMLSR